MGKQSDDDVDDDDDDDDDDEYAYESGVVRCSAAPVCHVSRRHALMFCTTPRPANHSCSSRTHGSRVYDES